jgi:hypothetical protein
MHLDMAYLPKGLEVQVRSPVVRHAVIRGMLLVWHVASLVKLDKRTGAISWRVL